MKRRVLAFSAAFAAPTLGTTGPALAQLGGGNTASGSTGALQLVGTGASAAAGVGTATGSQGGGVAIERGSSEKAVLIRHPLTLMPPPATNGPMIVPLGATAQGTRALARVGQLATLPFTACRSCSGRCSPLRWSGSVSGCVAGPWSSGHEQA
jgi:hypothetical protein